MNIMVIDNEEFLADNLCKYLKQTAAVNIEYATTFAAAIQRLTGKSFDLVITDIRLPDSKRTDWLLEVGKINPGQKIIIISSYPIPHKVSVSDKLNIIAYFEKPFDVKIIGNLIKEIGKH